MPEELVCDKWELRVTFREQSIAELRLIIERVFHCQARHIGGVCVKNQTDGKCCFHDWVESFSLEGGDHPNGEVYGWRDELHMGDRQSIVQLKSAEVDSPEAAIEKYIESFRC